MRVTDEDAEHRRRPRARSRARPRGAGRGRESRPTSRCCAGTRRISTRSTSSATLAWAGGYRSAARTAYTQAVAHHPDNAVGRVNLANLLREDSDVAGRAAHYEAALAPDPELHEAHQGMAWVLGELGLDGGGRAPAARILRPGSGHPALSWRGARPTPPPARLGARRQHPDPAVDRRSALHHPCDLLPNIRSA